MTTPELIDKLEDRVQRLELLAPCINESLKADLTAAIAALRAAQEDTEKVATTMADALMNEYPRMFHGVRIPGSVPENAAAERAYHHGNLSKFVRAAIDQARARDGRKWNNLDAQQRIDRGQHVRLPNALKSEHGERVGGKQSPEFTEWLMGWPIGWTDLRPLATDRFQQWLDSHGRH